MHEHLTEDERAGGAPMLRGRLNQARARIEALEKGLSDVFGLATYGPPCGGRMCLSQLENIAAVAKRAKDAAQ